MDLFNSYNNITRSSRPTSLTVSPPVSWITLSLSKITKSSTSDVRVNKKCLNSRSAYAANHDTHQTNRRMRIRFYTTSRVHNLRLSSGKKIRYYRLL
ncbi:hypothetical protein V2G26_007223 [Clonostachys chloroleuca]